MLRTIGGIVAGIVVVGLVLTLLEFVAHRLFPAAADGAPSGGTYAFVALAYFLATLAGAAVAAGISGKAWAIWLITVLVVCAAAYTLTQMSHPLWMQIASIAAPLLGGATAGALLRRAPSAGMDRTA